MACTLRLALVLGVAALLVPAAVRADEDASASPSATTTVVADPAPSETTTTIFVARETPSAPAHQPKPIPRRGDSHVAGTGTRGTPPSSSPASTGATARSPSAPPAEAPTANHAALVRPRRQSAPKHARARGGASTTIEIPKARGASAVVVARPVTAASPAALAPTATASRAALAPTATARTTQWAGVPRWMLAALSVIVFAELVLVSRFVWRRWSSRRARRQARTLASRAQ